MKFKSLFLGMLGAAAIVSCNNDVIDSGSVGNGQNDVIEGLPMYASMSINAGGMAGTYSGTSNVGASLRETSMKDLALYIYKTDASGFIPQSAVYIPQVATGNVVTMRTTSGVKKIFAAANPASNPTTSPLVNIAQSGTNFGTTSTDLALNFSINDTLSSSSATAVAKGAFATPAKGKADGLIVHFAMGAIHGDGSVAGGYGAATNFALMTNWDGPIDTPDGGTATPFDGNATFTLSPDIDSVTSIGHAQNAIDINVQRQYAKISLKFDATIPRTASINVSTPSGLATNAYAAAVGQDQEGRFLPWGSATTYRWSLGNITTAQLPFQQFDGSNGDAVRDPFYESTIDSLEFGATKLPNPTGFTNWTRHYDNTRVFPSTMTSYPMSGLSVTDVKTTMNTSNNYIAMTATGSTNPADAAYKYAYTTESARKHPVMKDHQTYAIVGGFYQPRKVITALTRAAIAENGTLPNTEALNYSWAPNAGDTLYYVAAERAFLSSKSALLAYYAWVKKIDIHAGGNPGGTISSTQTSPAITYHQDVYDAIDLDAKEGRLYAYFEGQCWYRIYLQNDAATAVENKVLVARNHIYDVTITSIKGPGIADPNKIIIPGETVLELDTYVSATIKALDWHRVEQGIDVDNK